MTLVERLNDRADPDPATGEYDLCPQDMSLLTEAANKIVEQAQRIEDLGEALIEARRFAKWVEVLVLDFDGLGEDGIKDTIQQNRWMNAEVKSIKTVEVDWTDDHPLNKSGTSERAYQNLFHS
jgi:predicted alpha-1,6-mannanase (GH76 family)